MFIGTEITRNKCLFSGDAAEYSKHLFRVLDSDKDNMVSWKEVMVGFHQLSPNGDPDAKLRLVYSVSIILKWKERGPKCCNFPFGWLVQNSIKIVKNPPCRHLGTTCSALLSGYLSNSGHLYSCIFLENMFSLQMYDIKGDKAVTTDDVKT